MAEVGSGPGLHDPHPAGAGAVFVSRAEVPEKFDAHAAVFVGVDLLARRSDNESGLQAVDARFLRLERRPEGDGGRMSNVIVGVSRGFGVGARKKRAFLRLMRD